MTDRLAPRRHNRAGRTEAKQDLEAQFRDGRLPPGSKLPTERALAERYRISRGTVRRVLEELEGAGWIERRPGSGTYLKRLEPASGAALIDAAVAHASPGHGPLDRFGPPDPVRDAKSVNPEEVMEARLLIEPVLARLIVGRATEHELEGLQTLVRAGAEASSMAEFELWDNRLHRALAAASKNKYLIQIVDGIHQARQGPAWSALRRRGLDESRRRVYQDDHERIVAALSARDAEAAEAAIVEHLHNVRRNLLLI
ncbi:MAG: FCD domain-containing protein [Marivibrio sp.]|uniref:FadR/GntR family transcriptional regulator n=1 Tax=Marivibrio sp. TaxID=2039719 RepID=UPI0032F03119